MPYIYCSECNGDIDDWQEAFKGCKHCGFEYFSVDDPDARSVMRALLDEIDELKRELEDLRIDFETHTGDFNPDDI